MNGYLLTKMWFSFVRNNLDKANCNHTAMYLYIVELFNQNQWVEVLGLPTDYTMASLNIRSYKTYRNILDDLISFKVIILVEKSKNQFTSNKIALVKNTKATTKAITLQVESNYQSDVQSDSTIIKLINKETIKLINKNATLVNSNLKKWIESETKQVKVKEDNINVYSKEVNDTYFECCNYFTNGLIPNTDSKKNKWLDTIEKLNRIDKMPFNFIIEITKKARQDGFWSKNFLSLNKLRQKDKNEIMYIQVFYEQFKNINNGSKHSEIREQADKIREKRRNK